MTQKSKFWKEGEIFGIEDRTMIRSDIDGTTHQNPRAQPNNGRHRKLSLTSIRWIWWRRGSGCWGFKALFLLLLPPPPTSSSIPSSSCFLRRSRSWRCLRVGSRKPRDEAFLWEARKENPSAAILRALRHECQNGRWDFHNNFESDPHNLGHNWIRFDWEVIGFGSSPWSASIIQTYNFT